MSGNYPNTWPGAEEPLVGGGQLSNRKQDVTTYKRDQCLIFAVFFDVVILGGLFVFAAFKLYQPNKHHALSTFDWNLGAQAIASMHNSSGQTTNASFSSLSPGYSALVAFGASYTDNAHARARKYNSTFRSYGDGGRYSNGPVEVEYMINTTTRPALPASSRNGSIRLLDYAYGGSMIDNDLSGGTSPSTRDQIAQFVSDVKVGTVDFGTGRLLVYFNSGINPLTVIFENILSANVTSASLSSATTAVNKNLAAVATQLQGLFSESSIIEAVDGMDFFIVGIPPLDIVPSFTYTANGNVASLAALKTLVEQFNTGLSIFATSFAGQLHGGNMATFFDLAALWQDFYGNGPTYGMTVTPISSTCYDSSTGSTCDKPTTFLYFDSLHPVTSCHLIMAEKMNAMLS